MPPLYSATNLLASATITATSPSTTFPPSQIADGRVGRPSRLGAPAGSWRADLGIAPSPVSFCSVHAHNLPADAMLQLSWSSDGSTWTSVPIDISAGTGEAWLTMIPIVARHWRLVVASGGTSPLGLPQVGEWWLGSHVTLPRSWRFGALEGRDTAGVVVRSEYGVPSGYLLSTYRAFSGDLPPMDGTLASAVEALREASRHGAGVIAFAPDSADRSQVIVGRVSEGGYRHAHLAPGLLDGGEISIIEDAWARAS